MIDQIDPNIDMINLNQLSVNQLIVIYNGYDQQLEQYERSCIKQKLINMGACSNYVLQYEGKL